MCLNKNKDVVDPITYLGTEYGIYFMEDSAYLDHTDYIVKDLLNGQELVKRLLLQQSQQMFDCDKVLTGTVFGKRYSALAQGVFDAWSQFELWIDANPGHVGIKLVEHGCLHFYLPKSTLKAKTDPSNETAISFVFDHLEPLFKAISIEANSQLSHMLSLVSHNLHETARILSLANPELHANIEKKLQMMITDTGVKGGANPLRFDFHLKAADNRADSYYVRKHCCLAYLIWGGHKDKCCSTCPIIARP